MNSERSRNKLGLFMAVTWDAVQHSKTRWRQEPDAPDAPLAVRLAAFQGDMIGDLERAFPGVALVPPGCLALLILKGVVEAGEDKSAIEAAAGVMFD